LDLDAGCGEPFDLQRRAGIFALCCCCCGEAQFSASGDRAWPSTISRGIRDLEDAIGVALVIRYPSGVTLSNAGEKFLNHARMAISRIEYALKNAGAAGRGESGMVRIGIFTSLASGFPAELLQAYDAENPCITLDLIEGGPAEHVSAVQHHRMDVASSGLCARPSARLQPQERADFRVGARSAKSRR
jgi:DNA-binding transcriptional LysR family regulator